MQNELVSHVHSEPRLGLFWFIPSNGKYRFASKSLPLSEVEAVSGIKTLEDGHPSVWKEVVRLDRSLRHYEYEFFPRGRVNWIEDDNRFLIVADSLILRKKLEKVIIDRFRLNGCSIRLLTDPHYRVNRLPTIFR